MNDQQFLQFLSDLRTHLQTPKVFVTDHSRAREFYDAVHIAEQLFPDAAVEIRDDPLQTGAMSLHIETLDVMMRGAREIKLFSDMVAKANNFEIYPLDDERVCFAAVFQGVNKRI